MDIGACMVSVALSLGFPRKRGYTWPPLAALLVPTPCGPGGVRTFLPGCDTQAVAYPSEQAENAVFAGFCQPSDYAILQARET